MDMATSCPHPLFQQEHRASASASAFDLTGVEITEKQNLAPRIAGLILQTVTHNKRRHDTLQRFMLATDSVTVAIEVPVSLTPEDISHMQQDVGFAIPLSPGPRSPATLISSRSVMAGSISSTTSRTPSEKSPSPSSWSMRWPSPGEPDCGSMTLSVPGLMSVTTLSFIHCTWCTNAGGEWYGCLYGVPRRPASSRPSPIMAATTPATRSQMVRSLGAPVKSSDKREPNEDEACIPKMISTTPTTSKAIPTTLCISLLLPLLQ